MYFGLKRLADATRRQLTASDGFTYCKSEWMVSTEDPILSPTIFLVEQPPGSCLRTHFHVQNEFQVVVQGSGSMGPHELRPGLVHYAAAYTGYGPLIAGPQGLSYFTVRAVFESGAHFIPEHRHLLKRGPKDQFHTQAAAWEESRLPPDRTAWTQGVEPLGVSADGAASASVLRLAPGAGACLPPFPLSVAQFALVLSGGLACGDQQLSKWESLARTNHDQQTHVQAGPAGAVVVLLTLSNRSDVYV